ncbi:MAG: STAS domain-containing protein [Cyanobacteriota bacterium]|nr:STAS domain-containing protein [Cyanobacteriota bacterium]
MTQAVIDETIATVEVRGSINAANAETFKKRLLDTLRSQSAPILLVDLARVELIDSAGLMALVAAYRLAKTLKRRAVLCSVSPSVRIIFELTQLDRRFEMYENRLALETALAHS